MKHQLIAIAKNIFDADITEEFLYKDRKEIAEWDSLAHLQLVAEVEEKFKIEIPFEEVQNITSLTDFLKYAEGEER